MSIASAIAGVASGLISPITNIFVKRNDNKTKITAKQIDRVMNAEDKHAEWEAIQAESSTGTWKDEYVTIIITLPIPCLFFAVVYSAYTGDTAVADSVAEGIKALNVLLPDYGWLLSTVCLAAIGIKALKR